MMNYKTLREEALREAACLGDVETLENLILSGVDVNSKNPVNGWTALHWAACRGNAAAVNTLLRNGADKNCANHRWEIPICVASTKEVLNLLGADVNNPREIQLPITPNYLRNPPLNSPGIYQSKTVLAKEPEVECKKDLLLRLRVSEEPDEFVEIEIEKSNLTFKTLKEVCAAELDEHPSDIQKIMKLPNTLIRNDKDVLRLKDFQEIACIITE